MKTLSILLLLVTLPLAGAEQPTAAQVELTAAKADHAITEPAAVDSGIRLQAAYEARVKELEAQNKQLQNQAAMLAQLENQLAAAEARALNAEASLKAFRDWLAAGP